MSPDCKLAGTVQLMFAVVWFATRVGAQDLSLGANVPSRLKSIQAHK